MPLIPIFGRLRQEDLEVSLKPAWSTELVPIQSGLSFRETMSWKKMKN